MSIDLEDSNKIVGAKKTFKTKKSCTHSVIPPPTCSNEF